MATPKPNFRLTHITQWLAGAFTLLSMISLLTVLTLLVRPLLFTPLGDYPQQQVLEQHEVLDPRDGRGIPIVFLSKQHTIRTSSIKCNNSDQNVLVSGSNTWVKESGNQLTIINGTSGSNQRAPGCLHIEYTNPIPSGVTPGLWRIRGQETAQGHDFLGDLSQTKIWQTELFWIAP